MAKFFFPASLSAAAGITDLFAFVWPTAAALWNLRWQVNGYLQVRPNASPQELNDRFVAGSELHGTDLHRASVQTTWDDQKSRFASIILMNAFAIYETWADEMVKVMQVSFTGKRLQYSNSTGRQGNGIESAIAIMTADRSPTLEASYYPVFSSLEKYSGSLLPNLMLAYRYFKEIRNVEMHSGGVASQAAQDAYTAFVPYSDQRGLGLKGELAFEPVIAGSPVCLHLRGVVGFCDILLRIIATVDAELCRSRKAESVLRHYLAASEYRQMMLSGDPKKRRGQVVTRCTRAGLPRPKDPEAIYQFLRAQRLIHV